MFKFSYLKFFSSFFLLILLHKYFFIVTYYQFNYCNVMNAHLFRNFQKFSNRNISYLRVAVKLIENLKISKISYF